MGKFKRVIGLDAIMKDFKKIERNSRKKILLPAVKKAVKVLKKQVKADCKWTSIRKLIKDKAFITRSGDVLGKAFVGPSKERFINIDGRRVGFEVVANILEFGRAAPGDAGGSKVVQPHPFIRTAQPKAGARAFAVMDKEVTRNLRRVLL